MIQLIYLTTAFAVDTRQAEHQLHLTIDDVDDDDATMHHDHDDLHHRFYTDPLKHHGQRDIIHHDGRLIFSELKSKTTHQTNGHLPLYPVDVNMDIEGFESSHGLTMRFDWQSHRMVLQVGLFTGDGLAWGRFDDRIASTGWSELYMNTGSNPSMSNDVTMYAAGYIEGILTCVRLSQFYANDHDLLMKADAGHQALSNVRSKFANEVIFMKGKANIVPHLLSEEPKESYWKQARYLLFQLWGLLDGYNYAAAHFKVHTFTFLDMLLLNSNAEIPTMLEAYAPLAVSDRVSAQTPPLIFKALLQTNQSNRLRGKKSSKKMTKEEIAKEKKRLEAGMRYRKGVLNEVVRQNRTRTLPTVEEEKDPLSDYNWERRLQTDGHCSAFVRVTEGNADMLVGHSTWTDYSEMTRIFKYYDFKLPGAGTAGDLLAFSSYPGAINSMDDFYMMSSGMVVMDTSLELLNPVLYDKVLDFPLTPHVPTFIHIMVCNRLAKTASHWVELYEQNSPNIGTSNAQWMIVDFRNFIPNKPLAPNTLWIIETIPGSMHSGDVTDVLKEDRYWASFNRPYFTNIRDASGHSGAEASHGDMYSWKNNPRAKIFQSSSGGIESLFEMRGLMTRNMYPYAGVEPNEPGHDVMARMDLNQIAPIPNGGIDTKIVNRCLLKLRQCQAISGPTHATQTVFQWETDGKENWKGWPHRGLPNAWNFGFVQMTPANSVTPIIDVADC